jgi:putative transposon-encoded protein
MDNLKCKRGRMACSLRSLAQDGKDAENSVEAVVVHVGGASYKASLEPVGVYSTSSKPLLPPEWIGKRVRVTLLE